MNYFMYFFNITNCDELSHLSFIPSQVFWNEANTCLKNILECRYSHIVVEKTGYPQYSTRYAHSNWNYLRYVVKMVRF